MDYSQITKQVETALAELLATAQLKAGQIVVVGCSTSEISGEKIGTSSSIEVAAAVLKGLLPTLTKADLFLAIQCCEHLNRALVVERECLERYGLDEVTVYPVQGAGGGLPNQAMKAYRDAVVVERIQAHAGLDIGDTFIGMHLKPVAIPVRGTISIVGAAHLTMARTRPKLIGGERARYQCQ